MQKILQRMRESRHLSFILGRYAAHSWRKTSLAVFPYTSCILKHGCDCVSVEAQVPFPLLFFSDCGVRLLNGELFRFCSSLYPKQGEPLQKRAYYQMVSYTRKKKQAQYYRRIDCAKQDGSQRVLYAPCPGLKHIQRGILKLLTDTPISPYARAYRKGLSILENASPHCQKQILVKLDLQDFFGSISFSKVYWAIDRALHAAPPPFLQEASHNSAESGNPYSISFYLARLCTLNGCLPQGAPTSPLLSNLVFLPIDRKIGAYCEKRGVSYTRYSDDMTFSGSFSPSPLISFVEKCLTESGFSLNRQKTRIAGAGQNQRVTGITVNEKPQAPKAYRRTLRQELYYIQKYGLEGHLRHNGLPDASPAQEESYLNQLLGRIGFVLQLQPNDQEFLRYRQICMDALRAQIRRDAALWRKL